MCVKPPSITLSLCSSALSASGTGMWWGKVGFWVTFHPSPLTSYCPRQEGGLSGETNRGLKYKTKKFNCL